MKSNFGFLPVAYSTPARQDVMREFSTSSRVYQKEEPRGLCRPVAVLADMADTYLNILGV